MIFIKKLISLAPVLFLGAYCAFARADDFDEIIKSCGRPDHDDSTLYDNPRPLIVARMIDYDALDVRFAFYLDSPVGQEPRPPYSWSCLGAMYGPGKKQVLMPHQALEKLSSECARTYIRTVAKHAKEHR